MKSVENTVAAGLCIGCGICSQACSRNAITMRYGENGSYQPFIEKSSCTDCGSCYQYCPHSWDSIMQESQKVADSKSWKDYGLEGAQLCVAYDTDNEARKKSASGGVTTKLLARLLEDELVDAVIHAQRLEAKTGQPHFDVCISKTRKELDDRRSSIYCVLSYDRALKALKDKKEFRSVAIVGVPCVIRGIKKLLTEYPAYRHITEVYTFALACSHNVNANFSNYLADSLDIAPDVPYSINLRNKDDLANAQQFKNHFYNTKGTLHKLRRDESQFLETWRAYAFSMKACNACSDFWGYCADISVKDAWGKWAKDPLGQSILVLRNAKLKQLFDAMDDVAVVPERYELLAYSQMQTVEYKQKYAGKRLKCTDPEQLDRVSSLHQIHAKIRDYSNEQYRRMRAEGYSGKIIDYIRRANRRMNRFKRVSKVFGKPLRILSRVRGRIKREHVEHQQARKLRLEQKKILVLCGFGGGNSGDQAQICESLKRLGTWFPEYMVKALIARRQVVYPKIGRPCMGVSPREGFFHARETITYSAAASDQVTRIDRKIINYIAKIRMRAKSRWIYWNACLIRRNLPPFLIRAEAAAVIYDIQTAAMVYFSGSGGFSGKTLSRLWEFLLVCRIARVFDVPVILSGQTIGDWDTRYNRRYAYKGLKDVKLIMARDPEESIQALHEIGISGEHVFSICDDALFCDKADEDRTREVLLQSGYDTKVHTKGYVVVNFHHWGATDEAEKNKIDAQIHQVIERILNQTDYNVILLPMVIGDRRIMDSYLSSHRSSRVTVLDYNYEYKDTRGVIAMSRLCVTMKHHPIIFAYGEAVPVISLSNKSYYEHKNGGALKIIGLEKMQVRLMSDTMLEEFDGLLKEALVHHDEIQAHCIERLAVLRKKVDWYGEQVKQVMHEHKMGQ